MKNLSKPVSPPTYTWNGQGTAPLAWSDAANWTPGGGPPGAGDRAVFDSAFLTTVTGDATVGQLQIISGGSDDFVDFAGTLTVAGLAGARWAMQVDRGAIADFDTGSALYSSRTVEVGVTYGTSTLNGLGATISARNMVLGAGTSTGLVSVDAGECSIANTLVIGAKGTGEFDLSGGGLAFIGTPLRHPPFNTGLVVLGAQAGATGIVHIGAGSDFAVFGILDLGGDPAAATHGIGDIDVGLGANLSVHVLNVDAGSAIALEGGMLSAYGANVTIAASASISGFGTIATSNTNFVNNGLLLAHGSLSVGALVRGSGSTEIGDNSHLFLVGASQDQHVSFAGANATLEVPQLNEISSVIHGFAVGDTIAADFANGATWDAATHRLMLTENGGGDGSLRLAGDYGGYDFVVHEQGTTALITLQAV